VPFCNIDQNGRDALYKLQLITNAYSILEEDEIVCGCFILVCKLERCVGGFVWAKNFATKKAFLEVFMR
jgi:hypothetical protein